MSAKLATKNEKKSLTKTQEETTSKTKYMAITGFMAAFITIMTAYVCHIPVGMNGGYVHFGDSLNRNKNTFHQFH